MNRKILAIVLMLSITAMLVTPIASEPNPNTATSLQIIGVDLVAVSIQNTTYVYPITLDNLTGNMLDWKTLAVAYVNYTLHVTYNNVTGPFIYANVTLKRTDIWNSSPDYYPITFTIVLGPGEDYTVNVTWHEETTMMNGIWKISLRTDIIGTAGVEVYDVNPANNEVDSPYKVKSIPYNETYTVGDFGSAPGVPPVLTWFAFDDLVIGWDITMFIMCYNGLAPPEAMYLGDLGGFKTKVPVFFAYDGVVDGGDLNLFLRCYNGQGPDP